MAIGLEKSAADVWTLCLGVALHKYVIAVCLGLELMAAQTKKVLFIEPDI